MKPVFSHLDVVKVVGQPPRLKIPVVGREGFIMGMNEAASEETREYAVHFNSFGELFCIPGKLLRSTGRRARREDIVTRSRLHRKGKQSSERAANLSPSRVAPVVIPDADAMKPPVPSSPTEIATSLAKTEKRFGANIAPGKPEHAAQTQIEHRAIRKRSRIRERTTRVP